MDLEVARISTKELLKKVNFLLGLIGLFVLGYAIWKYRTYVENGSLSPDVHPSLWFLYASACITAAFLCLACLGHAGAETANANWLTFGLPEDPTGAIDEISDFIANNNGLYQLVVLLVLLIQSECAAMALILKTIVERNNNDDGDPIPMAALQFQPYYRVPFG